MTTPEVKTVTFDDFDEALEARQIAWVGEGDGDKLPVEFYAIELVGELGELFNVIKKLMREQYGVRGSRATLEDKEAEFGDVLICLKNMAAKYGVNLEKVARDKFNATSEKYGFPHRVTAWNRRSPATMAVRGLEWRKPDPDYDYLWTAIGMGGRYAISTRQLVRIQSPDKMGYLLWGADDAFAFTEHLTIEAAKAAAQADYTARVLSALEPIPATKGDPVAWRWCKNSGDERGVWVYRETPPHDPGNITVQPLYAEPIPVNYEAAGEVTSRRLEWKDGASDSQFGEYTVLYDEDEAMAPTPWCCWAPNENLGHFASAEDAVRAAEEDFGRRCSELAERLRRGRGIYTASKTAHANRWRDLRASGWPIVSTWIDDAGQGETTSFEDLWLRCISEAASAYAILLYREPGEVLKGAFIEAGVALASGKPVHAIGCGEFSFVNHPLVTQHETLDAALAALAVAPKGGE